MRIVSASSRSASSAVMIAAFVFFEDPQLVVRRKRAPRCSLGDALEHLVSQAIVAHAEQSCDVATEGLVGPGDAAFPQRGRDGAVLVASEKRQLQAHAAALVSRVAVLP